MLHGWLTATVPECVLSARLLVSCGSIMVHCFQDYYLLADNSVSVASAILDKDRIYTTVFKVNHAYTIFLRCYPTISLIHHFWTYSGWGSYYSAIFYMNLNDVAITTNVWFRCLNTEKPKAYINAMSKFWGFTSSFLTIAPDDSIIMILKCYQLCGL